ncbi:thymidine kinase [Enemella evansiae]|uniref:Thymidine kinase n=1 Tax=Enemella evansiae TaxID=2016499 RepID=A0A255G3H2_9ACTN|nr:thymidine kinase [Enemella evansiae]PFG67011.1 thymidine kinase [Propionibacteriaceae bacterium ES.041]OYO02300.1 thymidine kinase [Enemella evansiae]OYO05498.1 thymidine kinase [Enemella evansiae]OYO10460.1 thymidine kinase [Enemella evansiae]OYO20379.1 thymidine kinase [Enemella evansiae]
MADLVFFTGPMDCGKSTLALQLDHTQRVGGRAGLLCTSQDRSGAAQISSRLGLVEPAVEVSADLDFWTHVVHALTGGARIDYLICDEAQFYTAVQIDQLARIVDELSIDVYAFGILSDFRTQLFPGSKRLVELADRIETPQVQPLCWCGQQATHNARTVDGRMVTEGSQVVVGDTTSEIAAAGEPAPEVGYEVLCRRHHRRRMTRAVAQATLSPEPLPFGSDEADEFEAEQSAF